MHIIDILYNKYYPLTVLNRIKSQRRNNNKDFSLIVSNCMGGYIYHQLGLPFLSPTINLMMYQNEFQRFIANLQHYLSLPFTNGGIQEGVPVGILGDIRVYFTHYKNYEEGITKFRDRAQRINWDNLYIITSDRDGVTESDLERLGSIKCKKLICFTAKKYIYPYCFQVEQFKGEECVGSILGKTISGKWKFEKFFDYISWLNTDDCVAEHFKKRT